MGLWLIEIGYHILFPQIKCFVFIVRYLVEQKETTGSLMVHHSLAFRGHCEKWSDSLRGNFKDLVELVSNYSPTMAPYISNLKNKNNKPQWSFISWWRQNELIECISDEIFGIIFKSMKDSPFFSVSFDTTFDVFR
ncbi:uncharacterized protein LOC112686975 [Sipha flava]|uniref:Uncharacterized protein LOC112686975 n=1 Tax=Sipha flava TaxID=143950 RepID=A0A8B8FY26_9HEMI|nr:uncharacterized protein LOC112686975 [Sipha flava]